MTFGLKFSEAAFCSKGGLSAKIHALVDALGNPLGFILTPGQAHDLEGADALLPDMAAEALRGVNIAGRMTARRRLADEYDAAQERGEIRTRRDNQAFSGVEKASRPGSCPA